MQTVSGRPPPAASMAVGQFFNPEEGKIELPPLLMLQSIYSQKVVIFMKQLNYFWESEILENISFLALYSVPLT